MQVQVLGRGGMRTAAWAGDATWRSRVCAQMILWVSSSCDVQQLQARADSNRHWRSVAVLVNHVSIVHA